MGNTAVWSCPFFLCNIVVDKEQWIYSREYWINFFLSVKYKAIKVIKSYIEFWHRQPWVSNPPPSLLIAPFLQPNHLLWSSSLLLLKYQNSKGEVWRGSTIFIKVFRKEPKRLVLRFPRFSRLNLPPNQRLNFSKFAFAFVSDRGNKVILGKLE